MAQRSGTRTTARSTRARTANKKARPMWQAFWHSMGSRILRAVLIALIVLMFNLVVSRNQYSLFFLWLGIELLVVFAFILLYLAWQQRSIDHKKSR